MTPIELHQSIVANWKNSSAATQGAATEYIRMLDQYSGPILQQAWDTVQARNEKWMPPKPPELVAVCRALMAAPQSYTSREPVTPPSSPILTAAQIADVNRTMDLVQLWEKDLACVWCEARKQAAEACPDCNRPGGAVDMGKMKLIGQGFLDRHQQAVERQR